MSNIPPPAEVERALNRYADSIAGFFDGGGVTRDEVAAAKASLTAAIAAALTAHSPPAPASALEVLRANRVEWRVVQRPALAGDFIRILRYPNHIAADRPECAVGSIHRVVDQRPGGDDGYTICERVGVLPRDYEVVEPATVALPPPAVGSPVKATSDEALNRAERFFANAQCFMSYPKQEVHALLAKHMEAFAWWLVREQRPAVGDAAALLREATS